MFLIAVRYDVNNFESSVVVQELELAMKRTLYRRKSFLVFLNTNSKLSGCVTTMVKNYRLFISRIL